MLSQSVEAQRVIHVGKPRVVALSDSLPGTLTSTRSLVIVRTLPFSEGNAQIRGEWRKMATELHRNFLKMGIDPVGYIQENDLFSGAEAQRGYLSLLENRQVKQVICVQEKPGQGYEMVVGQFDSEHLFVAGSRVWVAESEDLELLLLRLGRQILRQNLPKQNFLSPEVPEFLEDVRVVTGTRLESIPDRIRSLPLAVAGFTRAKSPSTSDPQVLREVENYNRWIDEQNMALKIILDQLYRFKYEIVDVETAEEAYQKGYQYVLFPLTSTGANVKWQLGYPTSATETEYIMQTYPDLQEVKLVRIPVNGMVTKFYLRQTIVKDLHTGSKWDADSDWQSALKNFLVNLNKAVP